MEFHLSRQTQIFVFLNGEKLRGCGFHRYVFAYVRSLSINETQDERERERLNYQGVMLRWRKWEKSPKNGKNLRFYG